VGSVDFTHPTLRAPPLAEPLPQENKNAASRRGFFIDEESYLNINIDFEIS
jgi:hypothetical protein